MVLEIIIAVLVFLLALPVRLNFLFYLNLLKNKGAVAVQCVSLPILQNKFEIASGQVTARNSREKEKTIDLSLDDENVIFLKSFVSNVIHKLVLDETFVGIEIGKKDDAMVTAMLSGGVLMFVDLIFAQVFSRKSGSNHEVDSEPYFCQNKLVLSMQSSLYLTIFDMLFCGFKAILKTKMRPQKDLVCEQN